MSYGKWILDETSKTRLAKLCVDAGVKTPVSEDSFHISMFMSERKLNPPLSPRVHYSSPVTATTTGLSTLGGYPVLLVQSDTLAGLRDKLVREHSIEHVYEDYVMHISLSYESENPQFPEVIADHGSVEVTVTGEVHEDYVSEWQTKE
eukprot:GFYU01004017.1.p1 GENE.GFYU01004017.1~~GFYU01004017.1.p1  ORF type:complete len:148 (-),score=2.86 GFYU01004017.1:165-608(-)